MSKNNFKPRALSKAEFKEIINTESEKYTNLSIKINNLHALSKYLFWINNFYRDVVKKKWTGDTSIPEVQQLLTYLEIYGKAFITLGYKKYFEQTKVTAYHWSENISNNDVYKQGDFSGLVIRISPNPDNVDNYFELSAGTPYIKSDDIRNTYHKLTQYVESYSKDNSVSDLNRIDDIHDLGYMFLPSKIAALAEDKIIDFIKTSDEYRCWIILQTGYSLGD